MTKLVIILQAKKLCSAKMHKKLN